MIATTDTALLDFAEEIGPSGPVAVEGSRTRWFLGGEPAERTRTRRAPAGILAYEPEEMTVRVRAGTSVADLHHALAEAGQRSALPERGGTVGGAVAVGEDDLLVLARGKVRSSVLQVRYVSAEGVIVTGGGPTVKNVSGFDLTRLMVGALGTLGLIAEVILRTNPLPAVSAWETSCDADPFATQDALHAPAAVLWDGTQTWVDLEGHEADVDAQRRVLREHGSWEVVSGPPALPAERWSLAPRALASLDGHDTGRFVASVGVGTVFASKPQPSRPVSPSLRALNARIKHEFDPTGRLNPGRDPLRGRT